MKERSLLRTSLLIFLYIFIMLPFIPRQALGQDGFVQMVDDIVNAVDSVPNSQFKNKNMKKAFTNKMNEVLALINEEQCEEALVKLEDDILKKTDGCAEAETEYPDQNDWLNECKEQDIIYPFLMEAMELLNASCVPFFEEYPGWSLPDLSVAGLTVEPERTDPNEWITLSATVSNKGKGVADSATLIFTVDGVEIDSIDVGRLEPGSMVKFTTNWTANGPGRHWVIAELALGEDVVDRTLFNNVQSTATYVSGETDPEPELVFSEIDFDALHLTAGNSALIPVTVRNPTFAQISDIPIGFRIDGVPVNIILPPEPPGSDVLPSPFISLAPGEELELHIPWTEVTSGQHTIAIQTDLPDTFTDAEFQSVKIWNVMIADIAGFCLDSPGSWESLGPRLLFRGSGGLPSGSVGRMDRIAFHPDDLNTIYAAAPNGGVWKTGNRGDDWTPIGDELPSLNARAIVVDPKNPNVIYVSTIQHPTSSGMGIHKSIDGGLSWELFAERNIVGDVGEIFISYTSTNEVMLYVSNGQGVLRYKSNDPKAKTSNAVEWDTIKTGIVKDLAVSPSDSSLVYVSLQKQEWSVADQKWVNVWDGLYRTKSGETATGDSDWMLINSGLPTSPAGLLTLDIWKKDPKNLYAAISHPFGVSTSIDPLPTLAIYESKNEGDSWSQLETYGTSLGTLYNPFIRVHPKQPLIYFGGVKLYKKYVGSPLGPEVLITRIHDDMKILEFDPFNSNFYYILNDGGIWRCESKLAGDDTCVHRNNDLRTTQFYDLDVSPNNRFLMVGGTQDNGTILYTGFPDWNFINGGDGLFSLIASPDNPIVYAQHQFLRDTRRCDKGGDCLWVDWTAANGRDDRGNVTNGNELPRSNDWGWNNAYITVHPTDADTLLSQGPEVYHTTDGGKNWYPKGPKGTIEGKTVNGHITRVVFQPQTHYWIAGTDKGQIWYTKDEAASWRLLYEHPFWKLNPAVVNMAFAPKNNNVLYVIFKIGGAQAYTRIIRIHLNLDSSTSGPVPAYMAGFPKNLTPQVIIGDGYNENLVYVGTNQGGVYRWDATEPFWSAWQAYNTCLPSTVDVRDLLVDPTSKELRAATWGRGAWTVRTAITDP